MNLHLIKESLAFGYKKTLENLSFLVRVSGAVLIFTFLINSLQKMASDSSVLTGAFFFALTFAVDIIIKIGYTKIYLALYDGHDVHLKDVFSHHGKFFTYCVAYVALSLLTLVGFGLFILPGFFVIATFFFVPFLVIDQDISVIDAFKKSYELTKGKRWYVLLYLLLAFILNGLGLALFVIGLLITIPITYFSLIFLYRGLLETNQ
ncbi:MAG: hypothetical protein RL094_33 [Candidatus Parcubacteria bacterium]